MNVIGMPEIRITVSARPQKLFSHDPLPLWVQRLDTNLLTCMASEVRVSISGVFLFSFPFFHSTAYTALPN